VDAGGAGGVKAIETRYKGYRFRSRLEARWAVFFDALNIEYAYESEGYDLKNDVGWYLPDFWLPQVNMYAEVKGNPFTLIEENKCFELTRQSGYGTLMLAGPPDFKSYWGYVPSEWMVMDRPGMFDFLLCGTERYWESEGRFYIAPSEIEIKNMQEDAGARAAVYAARSARFEHGETP
jgi:hypothetical protein